jgi:hypothetical protein
MGSSAAIGHIFRQKRNPRMSGPWQRNQEAPQASKIYMSLREER